MQTAATPLRVYASPGFDYLVIMDLEASSDDPHDVNRQEIVEWPWVVYDLRARVVVDSKQIYIAPQWSSNPNPSPEIVRGLGTDVAFSPSLKDAVAKFDTYLYHSFRMNNKTFCLLTDGPWELRQILMVEGARKAVSLAPHFRTYFDLRTEFCRCYPTSSPPRDRQAMVSLLNISAPEKTFGLDSCHVVSDIVARLQHDGHVFANPEVIPEINWAAVTASIPAVAVPVAAAVPVGGIVRLRGLPWTCVEQDVIDFFQDIPVVSNGVHFVRNAHGKATGEAFVQLQTPQSVSLALQRHKKNMGRRYIEVFKSSPADMSNHLGRADARRQLHQQQVWQAQAHKAAAAAAANAIHRVNPDNTSSRVPLPSVVPGSPFSMYYPAALPSSYTQGSLPYVHQQQHYATAQVVAPQSVHGLGVPNFDRYHSASVSARNGARGDVVSGTAVRKSYILKLRGVPSDVSPDDIVCLFDGLEMVGDGVHLLPSLEGRRYSDIAFVEFPSEAWAKKALARSPLKMETATVCVERSSFAELLSLKRSYEYSESSLTPVPTSHGESEKDLDESGTLNIHENAQGRGEVASVPTATSSHNLPLVSEMQLQANVDRTEHKNCYNLSNGLCGVEAEQAWIARVTGLPLETKLCDVASLFKGFSLCDNGIFLALAKDECRIAYVAFLTKKEQDRAVESFDSMPLGRFENANVRILPVSNDGYSHTGDDEENITRDGVTGCVIRMIGIPSWCCDQDIIEFFAGVEISREGILRSENSRGKSGREAWVQLVSREQASFAGDRLNKRCIGDQEISLIVV